MYNYNHIDDIENLVNFRYKQEFESWDYPNDNDVEIVKKVPRIFSHFYKVIWPVNKKVNVVHSKNNNKNILCCVDKKCINILFNIMKNIGKCNILIICGEDWKLSYFKKEIDKLINYFNTIYFEAKDIEYKNVKTIPMGMNKSYLLKNGGNKEVLNTINQSNMFKKYLITTAYGHIWSGLNNELNERKNLTTFCNKTKWITKQTWNPLEYYSKLSEYKYFIVPIGNGIQRPAIFECFLVKTVPVVIKNHVFEDIQSYGYPLLIINNFNELTERFLENNYENKFKNVNWKSIIYSLTTKGFIEKFNL